MSTNRRKKDGMLLPAVPGASSMLVIFAVLALTVLAVFTLSMAAAEAKLAETAVEAIIEYYEADCEAERVLAELRRGAVPEGVTVKDGVCSYQCRISEKKVLQVEAAVEGSTFRLLKWQTVPVGLWEADGQLNLWDGEVVIEEGEKGDGIWPL